MALALLASELSYKSELRWSCGVHKSPTWDTEEAWNWPVLGCSCATGRWWGTGRKRLVRTTSLDRLLREVYLPPLAALLNADPIR